MKHCRSDSAGLGENKPLGTNTLFYFFFSCLGFSLWGFIAEIIPSSLANHLMRLFAGMQLQANQRYRTILPASMSQHGLSRAVLSLHLSFFHKFSQQKSLSFVQNLKKKKAFNFGKKIYIVTDEPISATLKPPA